jgi:hypothetical protein
MNNSCNLFDFDVEAYRAHCQQGAGGQSEDARHRTDFDQQLARLKLSSSGEDGSPDARDSSSNSCRHSVDIPDPVSSPEIQTKKGKNRGLWSRTKSGVGKLFSGSHSEKPFGAPKQQEVVLTNVHYTKSQPPRIRIRGVFEEDEELLRSLQDTGLAGSSVQSYGSLVRKFSAWLHSTGREPIAGRLGDRALTPGLVRDLQAAYPNSSDEVLLRPTRTALNALRKIQLGNPTRRRPHTPYIADAALIRGWYSAQREKDVPQPTCWVNARRLSILSEWLRTNNRGAMAERCSTQSLDQDVKEYIKECVTHKKSKDLHERCCIGCARPSPINVSRKSR